MDGQGAARVKAVRVQRVGRTLKRLKSNSRRQRVRQASSRSRRR
jgi:hypothetical protein